MTTDLRVLLSLMEAGSVKVVFCEYLGRDMPWFADVQELKLVVRSHEDLHQLLAQLNAAKVLH